MISVSSSARHISEGGLDTSVATSGTDRGVQTAPFGKNALKPHQKLRPMVIRQLLFQI